MSDVLAPERPETAILEAEAQRMSMRTRLARLGPALPAIVWVSLFIVVPMLVMFVYSFWRYSNYEVLPDFNFDNYLAFVRNTTYSSILLRTVFMALGITLISVVLAYPFSYFLAHTSRGLLVFLVVLVMIPLWTNTIIRNFAWFSVFGEKGLINALLMSLGLISKSIPILFTPTAVVIVGVYISLSFAALSLFPVLEKLSPSLAEAAKDLGATPPQAFRLVTLPLSMAGVQAATLLVFVPTLGLFLTPAILGGPSSTMIANLVVPFFTSILNYAQGAALSFVTVIMVVIAIAIFGRSLDLEKIYASGVGSSMASRTSHPQSFWLRLYVIAFVVFLFIPIAMLFIFSLNQASNFPLREWTLDWYNQAITNAIVLESLRNSLIIGVTSSICAVAVAAPLAYGIVRFKYRYGGLLKSAMLIPMIIPGFMLGAALLIVLNRFGLAFSLGAIIVGHVTYVLPFIFLVLLAQQHAFDKTLEEAARDLGATEIVMFQKVTLPLMVPAILAGGLFAFTLSLDEFIITFLLSGSTLTLPMYIYGLLKGIVPPSVNALGVILLVGAVVLLGLGRLGQLVRIVRSRAVQRARARA